MATVQYSCDFKHPFIRVEWQHRKLGETSWIPVDTVFGDSVSDQAGNTIVIDLDTLPSAIDDFYGHVRAMSWTPSGQTAVTREAALSAELDVFVSPLELVIAASEAQDPWYVWDFATRGWDYTAGDYKRMGACTVAQTDGTVDHLAEHEPAIITGVGLQIEEASTNYLRFNTDFSGWSDRGLQSLMATGLPSPDGMNRGSTLHLGDSGGGQDMLTSVNGVVEDGAPLIFSGWIKAKSSSPEQANVALQSSSGGSSGRWYYHTEALDPGELELWARVTGDHHAIIRQTEFVSLGGSVGMVMYCTTADPYHDADYFGLQMEGGNFESSMIPTPDSDIAERSDVFAEMEIAAMGLPTPVQEQFSFHQKADVLYQSAELDILIGIQDQSGFVDDINIGAVITIYTEGGFLKAAMKARLFGAGVGWSFAAETLAISYPEGMNEFNLRGKAARVGNGTIIDVWLNDQYQRFTMGRYVDVELGYVALLHRNGQLVTNGVCKEFKFSDVLLDDSIVQGWGT